MNPEFAVAQPERIVHKSEELTSMREACVRAVKALKGRFEHQKQIPKEQMSLEQLKDFQTTVTRLNEMAEILTELGSGISPEWIRAHHGDLIRSVESRSLEMEMDLRNDLAQKFHYRFVGRFAENGLAVAKPWGKEDCYYIDRTGAKRLGPFWNAKKFVGDFASVEEAAGQFTVIDSSGNNVLGGVFDRASVESNGKIAVRILHQMYLCSPAERPSDHNLIHQNCMHFHSNGEGVFDVFVPIETGITHEFAGENGIMFFGNRYGSIKNFSEGIAFVRQKNCPWIAIDENGHELKSFRDHDVLEGFCDGFAVVRYLNRSYFIDHTLQEVIGSYFSVTSMVCGHFFAKKEHNSNYQLYGKDGKLVSDTEYFEARSFSDEGVFRVEEFDGSVKFVDTNGREVFYSQNPSSS